VFRRVTGDLLKKGKGFGIVGWRFERASHMNSMQTISLPWPMVDSEMPAWELRGQHRPNLGAFLICLSFLLRLYVEREYAKTNGKVSPHPDRSAFG